MNKDLRPSALAGPARMSSPSAPGIATRHNLRVVTVPSYPLDESIRARIAGLARGYLQEEVAGLEADGLLPVPGRDSPWIDQQLLWRRRRPGRDAGHEFAKVLEELLPTRWVGPAGHPGAARMVEGLLRGSVAARTVGGSRIVPFGEREPTDGAPGGEIDEFLDLIEHPEQPWRVMRLLLDLDSRAVEGESIHDARLRPVRGLAQTISLELPEGARRSMETDVHPGSHEPRTFLIADRRGRDGWMVAREARPHLVHASAALRIVTAGTTVEPLELSGQPRMVHAGGPDAVTVDPMPSAHFRRVGVVEPGQLGGIEAIASQLCALDDRATERIPPAMLVAISRYLRSHRAAAWSDVVIDIAIALEAALSTGDKDEITLRIRMRAANLLARPADGPGVIFHDVGELLSIRGRVAHGEHLPQKRWEDFFAARGLTQVMVEDRLAVLFDRWRDLVRRAILARLLLDREGLWRIGGIPPGGVDAALIDPMRRRDWRRAVRRRSAELGIPTAIDPPAPLRDTLHHPSSQGMEH